MEEKEILKLLLNQSCIGYWEWNIKENTAKLNDTFVTYFGYEIGELFAIGDGITLLNKLMVAEDQINFQNSLNQYINTKTSKAFELEVRYYRKNRSILWVVINAQVVERDENNNAIRIIGTHKEITKYKEQNQHILKEYNVLQLILNEIPQSVFWRDNNNVYLGCNKPFARSLGKQLPEEIIGKTNHEFPNLEKKEIDFYHQEDREVLSNAKSRLHFVGQIFNNDGNRIWVDSSKIPLKDQNGKPYGILGIFSDITEHENIKQELLRTNKLYNILRQINELLLNIHTKEDLYNQVCKIITETGGFQLVWIGEIENQIIVSKAYSGNPKEYILNLEIETDIKTRGYSQALKNILDGKKCIYNDFFKDIDVNPWNETALKSGIKSSANIPIQIKGITIGALTVYADTINYFQYKEVLLLEEIAMAISFGIDKINKEFDQKLAENKIKLLASIIEHSKTFAGIANVKDKSFTYLNAAVKEALNINEDEDITTMFTRQFHTQKAIEMIQKIAIPQVMKKGIWVGENEMMSRSGKIIPVLQTIMLHTNENNEPEFLSTTAIDITNLKKKEEELNKIATDLRSLSNHLISIREEERKIIAKEIHDELGQNLAILKMDAAWISIHLDGDRNRMQERIKQFNEITDETVKTSRRLYNSLYPQMIDDIGLVGAIKWHADKYFENNNDFALHFNTTLDDVKLPPENNQASLVLFRIYQECFTNIMRHAKAAKVEICLEIVNGFIKMIIQDDGVGFIVNEVDTMVHHGLIGMRERVFALNGTINIQSQPGKGTITSVSIPLL